MLYILLHSLLNFNNFFSTSNLHLTQQQQQQQQAILPRVKRMGILWPLLVVPVALKLPAIARNTIERFWCRVAAPAVRERWREYSRRTPQGRDSKFIKLDSLSHYITITGLGP